MNTEDSNAYLVIEHLLVKNIDEQKTWNPLNVYTYLGNDTPIWDTYLYLVSFPQTVKFFFFSLSSRPL